jgi:23S rRNA pseudouridine1911/1915/1917 synthase
MVMEISRTLRFVVDKRDLRLDKYVFQLCGEFSRSYIQKLIEEGHVTVNAKVAKPSLKTKEGDVIIIALPPPQPSTPVLLPESLPLSVVYEDSYLLVIDKPAGITVHPAPGHSSHTLINAILAYCPDILDLDTSIRPGIVHRLDKNTSPLS